MWVQIDSSQSAMVVVFVQYVSITCIVELTVFITFFVNLSMSLFVKVRNQCPMACFVQKIVPDFQSN